MAETIKVPGVGPTKKKTAIGVGIGVAVLGVIFYIRQRKASSAAPAAAAGTTGGQQTDPAGNVGTIDPATGYVYGSAEDQQALASLQQAGMPYDTSGLGGGLGGYYYGPGGSTQPVPPGPGNFADNAEWAQYAENYMIGTLSADPNATGNALGKYITGQPVDSTQQNVIEEAIAIAGQPPQAGPGGYPPGIRTQPSGGGGGGPTVTVPNTIGQSAGSAHNLIVAAGLVPTAPKGQTPDMKVSYTRPLPGTKVAKGSKVTIETSGYVTPPPKKK